MAEEYCGGANWWDSSPNNNRSSTTTTRFDGVSGGGGGGSSTSSTTTLANSTSGAAAGYGWLTETSATDTKLDASSLQLMGLGLSNSPTMEWNQHILRNPEKTDNSFRTMLQEGMGLGSSFQQEATGAGAGVGAGSGAGGVLFSNTQLQWRPEKLFPSNEDSPELKHIGQQPQFSPSCSSMESSITCNNNNNNNQGFQLDSSSSSSVYGSPSSILQGLMGHDQQNNHQHQQLAGYGSASNNNSGNYQQNYFGMPQFLRASSPKQQQQQQQQQLQFMNNAPYWNASAAAVSMNDVRPNFFSSLQAPPQLSMPSFEEKPKATMEIRDTNSSMVKKSNTSQENNTKRARNDAATSTLPPFKVRKEKMGDRITALQQLVSPFGKTDTASVLSEAIEYIKFLHEQVSVLSNPYLKSGAPYQQQQPNNEKTKVDPDGPKQDLRSRGLCLVPVSSTFPVTHETTVDFWTPTFGGTFR